MRPAQHYTRTLPVKLICLACALMLTLGASINLNAWQSKPRQSEQAPPDFPVAYEINARGDSAKVIRGMDNKISLHVTLAPGFIQFAPNNCPTLQIDTRLPVHHTEVGDYCSVKTLAAVIELGRVQDSGVISLPLYRLMNGTQLSVRFVTSSGEYRELKFTLRNSKQAIKAALGDDVKVTPKVEPASAP
ncbi:MAG: hypothetical protein ACU84Q_21190 [Gammaproteobacteria bacterium]